MCIRDRLQVIVHKPVAGLQVSSDWTSITAKGTMNNSTSHSPAGRLKR